MQFSRFPLGGYHWPVWLAVVMLALVLAAGRAVHAPAVTAQPVGTVTIQKELVDPIARRLLAGELEDGGVIAVGADDGGLSFGRATLQ